MKLEISGFKKMFSRDSKKMESLKGIEQSKDESVKRFVRLIYQEVTKLNQQIALLSKLLKESNDKIKELERKIDKYNPDNSPKFIKGDLEFTENQIEQLKKHNITIEQYMKNLQHAIKSDVLSIFKKW